MKLIVCLDDRNGMAFNHRRQSRDRVLCEDIARMVGGESVWMNAYSVPLFEAFSLHIEAKDDYLCAAGKNDWCFCERESIASYAERIDMIVVYRWNRRYPGDVFFSLAVSDAPWKRISMEEFSGSSHEKITKEVYVR